MKLMDWLKSIGHKAAPASEMSDEAVVQLIRFLENPGLDCEQVDKVLDEYAEIEIRKEDAARLMPLVREHLDMCHSCCDEYEALLDVLAKANPPDPSAA